MAVRRIILVDDHEIFRVGLRNLIDKDPVLKVVAEAASGEELLKLLGSVKAHLIVLDISMPDMDGIEALKRIRKRHPKLKVLVLTMQKDQEHLKHAIQFGAAGYVLKEDAYEQLALAIKLVLKGKHYVSPKISSIVADRFVRSIKESEWPSLDLLTKRERDVLKMVAGGLANKNIAVRLNISIRTVETHRANLTNKLGIKNTANLVKYAIHKGLI